MSARQAPEDKGGPAAEGAGHRRPPTRAVGETALWGEELPWLDEPDAHSFEEGDGSSPVPGAPSASGVRRDQVFHMAAGTAGWSSRAPTGTRWSEPAGDRDARDDAMGAPPEEGRAAVLEPSGPLTLLSSPAGARPAGKAAGRRRGRRGVIPAVVMCAAGLVAVSAAAVTQRTGDADVSAEPETQVTVTETMDDTPAPAGARSSEEGARSPSPSARATTSPSPAASVSAPPSPSATRPSGQEEGASSSASHAPAAPHPATTRPTTAAPASREPRVVQATTVLNPGQALSWGKGALAMTSGGDLVVTDENGTVRWAAHTSGSDLQTVFQDDGCMAVYDPRGNVHWSSYTNGNPGAVLVLTADGDVQIRQDGRVLWQTGTGH